MEKTYLESARLCFLRPAESDLPFIEKLLGSRALTEHPGPLPQADRIAVVARGIVDRWRNRPYGTCLIQFKATGQFIGLGGIKDLEIEGKLLPDLGFMFLKEFQSQGLGFEAGEAIVRHGFLVHGLPRIVANTTLDNHGALALLRKLGFSFLEVVDYEIAGVAYHNSQMWQLTREQFESRLR